MNLCRECGKDFGSTYAFDKHRTGKHEYTHAEGLVLDPPADDGRRCLDNVEMAGWGQDGNGRWRTPGAGESPWGT